MRGLTREQTDFCKDWDLTPDQFFGNQPVLHDLTIDTDTLPDGFSPNVMGVLLLDVDEIPRNFHLEAERVYLPNLRIIPSDFKPVVNSHLVVKNAVSMEPGFNPNVGVNMIIENMYLIPVGLMLGYINEIAGPHGQIYIEKDKIYQFSFLCAPKTTYRLLKIFGNFSK
jgi:hypothetical protein